MAWKIPPRFQEFDIYKALWERWNLKTVVLFSLSLQFVLALTAPLRKHSRKRAIPFVWLPYLLAINYAIGAISMIPNVTVAGSRMGNLRIFWGPFLILHLGCPNSITALSLADHELWLRHATIFLTLSYTFSRVFYHSFEIDDSLWLPTMIMFLAGTIKYNEKLVCLFKGRLAKFRESCLCQSSKGVNYGRHAEVYLRPGEASGEEIKISYGDSEPEPSHQVRKLTQVQIVKDAYNFFCEFKGLFVNCIFSPSRRDKSRHYFLCRDAEDALRVCEVELNFAYDIFYTKAILIDMMKWPFQNILSLFLQIASLVLWIRLDKSCFQDYSIRVTCALVGGSIALELFYLFAFLTSDWCAARMKTCNCFYEMVLRLKQPQGWFRLFFDRWSNQIPQLNVIAATLENKWKCSLKLSKIDLSPVWVDLKRFTDNVGSFVFNELKLRSCSTEEPEDACKRGSWLLARFDREYEDKGLGSKSKSESKSESLSHWITGVEYEESLIQWHIATQLCYSFEEDDDELREMSKTTSDYLLYLLILQPTMMPEPSQIFGRLIFQDTCAEAERFFKRVLPKKKAKDKKERVREACEKILRVNTDVVSPWEIKGNKSRSVLFDACILAKRLRGLTEINKWEVISKVWADLLVYAAAECRPCEHVERLRHGGELLTLVWLLMTHLGLGKQFRVR